MEDPAIRNWMLLYLTRLGHKEPELRVLLEVTKAALDYSAVLTSGHLYLEEAAALKSEWEKKDTFMGSPRWR